ncbi:hypothetical protein CYLTODRAFT_372954 [Cylindrobasidium torrendii FP15055 ss-10]|uniref:Protein kinase domain-containing protein n=1 Tax=Cylindrobasidium torrendii FP15055 ss-10 TaxID=1314674 RepID=A0A0D7BI63_9AGAR|nr:hypothetical protein CYLTODRAFT_372954 [Cylindrobasidium torrendii FP15055 ss-10]
MEALVSPVLSLLSQLRAPCIPCPLQATLTNLGQGSSCITISSIYSGIPDSPPVRAKTPALIVLPQGSLENGETGPNLPSFTKLFGSVWRAENDTNIICTDLRWLFILRLSKTNPKAVIYECLRLDPELVAARVVLAAYIHETLPNNAYLTYPQTIAAFDPPTVHGCQVDPSIPMLPDEEVFATHKRHHDFDLYMLMNRPALALQFLRWKSHMQTCVSEIHTVRSGDNLLCSTDGFAKQHHLLVPYWPVDIQTIPTSTMECIRAVARPHALDEPARIRLAASAAFELEISDQLAPGREPRGATVHRCRITSIDGEAILSAGAQNLCVKLFDDRLLDVYPPEEPEEGTVDADADWWVNWSTSEECVRREHVTYQQLSYAQGSLVPWYYGAHKFIRPDGHHLYGILMEYIPDAQMMADIASKSEELEVVYRIELIRNARHLVRAMQYSDVSQHDFHREQFMVLNTPVPHLVMYDFARASTSTKPEKHEQGDYLEMLWLLVRSKLHKGQDGDTFLAHYGEPEVWDMVSGTVPLEEKGGPRWISAQDPFAWVYTVDS